MHLVADLHVHSRFSRATSADLDFVALHRAALQKGVGLVGTGDFTHPAWMREIQEQLEPAEGGLFRLRPALARKGCVRLPPACAAGEVRFVLQVEISCIYKKDGRVRKNHNLVYVPSLDSATRLIDRLGRIGNLASDGRPILGLDARDLLEIVLETDPLAFLIPAHIWTPWFSMLGSKSGFDSVEECFGDLASHVFAVETGLSSDPGMNWRVSRLDALTLVSNSDAHSPGRLAREANVLDIDPGYESLLRALRSREGLIGTVEFFPQEGKYHLDGHRRCAVRLEPEQTRELGGRCPACGGPLTVGVLSRVLDLADRPAEIRPPGARPFVSLVSLHQAACEALGVGPSSQRAADAVARVLAELGPELVVLRDVELDDIRRVAGAPFAEAVRRIRSGRLHIDPGFDGEFGTVQVFSPGERERIQGQAVFALGGGKTQGGTDPAAKPTRRQRKPAARTPAAPPAPSLVLRSPQDPRAGLNEDQLSIAEHAGGPMLVVAGPGTGKTHTLVARIASALRSGAVHPDQVLAIAFTNQAADELTDRLEEATGAALPAPAVSTFHRLGLWILRECAHANLGLAENSVRLELVRSSVPDACSRAETERLARTISAAKQTLDPRAVLRDPAAVAAFDRYESLLADEHLLDLDDLVLRPYRLLCGAPALAARLADRFRIVAVDEYQDVNDVQAALVSLLAPLGQTLFVIGDPDQAIYGFRGARPGHFLRFLDTYPDATSVALRTSYRLTQPIAAVANSVVRSRAPVVATRAGPPVEIVECPTPQAEAEQVVVRMERLLGGTSLFAVDSGRGAHAEAADIGFGDIAVLSRTKAQRAHLLEALERAGVPARSVGDDEAHDPRSQKVAVLTMHAAKGREFEVVFVTGVERGLLPLELAGHDVDTDEERRLLYVAVTRAKRVAVLSHCQRRTLFGTALPGGPSDFLAGVPAEAVIRTRGVPTSPRARTRQLDLF